MKASDPQVRFHYTKTRDNFQSSQYVVSSHGLLFDAVDWVQATRETLSPAIATKNKPFCQLWNEY